MNILVLGSGGREHALAWRLSRDQGVERVTVAPGNSGLESEIHTVSYDGEEGLLKVCKEMRPDLVVVGPEGPLVQGIVDRLKGENVLAFGPSAKASQLEGSKIFSKRFMEKYSIPTAPYRIYSSYTEAVEGLRDWDLSAGVAIKTDTLAGGKGVVVSHSFDEARDALYNFMENPRCTVKSDRVLIEKKLSGKELSWFALCDGERALSLGGVCDYKRVGEGDTGSNTGGMGCYTPRAWPTEEMKERIQREVVEPTIQAMAQEGTPYRGTLFAGLMIDGDKLNVLEFNIRFGDPETQTLLPLVEGNLARTLFDCARGELPKEGPCPISLSKQSSVHVVMASGGYPTIDEGKLDIGHPIVWEREGAHTDTKIFFAGVKKMDRDLVNSGGRVLGVTGWGANVEDARDKAYFTVENISFRGGHWRGDIARGVSE